MMNRDAPQFPVKTVAGIAVAIVLFLVSIVLFRPVVIQGNQLGIKETTFSGVSNVVMTPRTYFVSSLVETIYRYNMTPKILSFGQVGAVNGNKIHDGCDFPEHRATSSDNQIMEVAIKIQWQFDPNHEKMLALHKAYHPSIDTPEQGESIIENNVLYPRVVNAINTSASHFKAIEAYSGEGFVRLQDMIRSTLMNDKDIAQAGIQITNVTIDTVRLDSTYIGEINARQLAEMKTLRAKQEEIAAEAQSKVAKAIVQSDYEKLVVEAERKKQVDILESEARKQQTINEATAQAQRVTLDAKAQADRVVLAAEAEQKAGTLKAEAILALGKAEAEATRLKMEAYNSSGSQNWVVVEVSRNLAEGFKGIQGYIPQNMTVNTLSGNFIDGLRTVVGSRVTEPVKPTK